ncbi:MAG TPA: porin [Gemmataceae bacterium]|nr:porin [Gemmataceae bacterium]
MRRLRTTWLLLAGLLAGCNSISPALSLSDESEVAGVRMQNAEAQPGDTEPKMEDAPKIESPLATTDAGLKASVRLIGRIEADAIMVSQTQRDKALIGDLENATGFRRLRLGAKGDIGDQVAYQTEFDFATGNFVLRDTYLAVTKLPIVNEVRAGYFREPFSLEQLTSSNYFPFMERSPVNALDPPRHWGAAFYTHTDDLRATLAAGIFRSGTNNTGTDITDNNDMAYTARATALPWNDTEGFAYRLFQVGGAFSQRYPKNNIVTFEQGPRSSLLQPASDNPLTPIVPNIAIPANQYQQYDLECLLILDSLSFQAEWTASYIEQIGGSPVFLHGSYAFVSYFLTGEHRQYDPVYASFRGTRVRRPFVCLAGQQQPRGLGAWELVARFSYLNFDDPNLPLAANGLKVGERLATGTFGINWYLNDYARIMFNYSRNVPVDPNFGPSGADSFSLRCAVFW